MYVRNINSYLMEGQILLLNKNTSLRTSKDYKALETVAKTLIGNLEVEK